MYKGNIINYHLQLNKINHTKISTLKKKTKTLSFLIFEIFTLVSTRLIGQRQLHLQIHLYKMDAQFT